MSRRKKGRVLNGWLVLDKPQGLTSNQALGAVKRLLQPQKAGHAGTLDPLATGILPIALGEATKTVPYAVEGEKAYRFTVRWGAETTTDDTEGEAVRTSAHRPAPGEIARLLSRFTGEILQTPPRFSAIKVGGERAYDLARDGEEFTLDARKVLISSFKLVAAPDADTAVFETRCGKGTYVRALARDMGQVLGCFGHVIALRRTEVGAFTEKSAVTLERLEAAVVAAEDVAAEHDEKPGPCPYVLPVEMALDALPMVQVTTADASHLLLGRSVLIRGRDAPVLAGIMYAMCQGRLVALGEIVQGALHPTRIFHLG